MSAILVVVIPMLLDLLVLGIPTFVVIVAPAFVWNLLELVFLVAVTVADVLWGILTVVLAVVFLLVRVLL